MKKYLLATAFAATQIALLAQMSPELATTPPDFPKLTATANAAPYAATITAEDIRSHLTVLASDEYEGRETGE
ncbi:MAG: hypothetical protein MUC59_15975, partial [Saprospiraceae bacterium]|nr:hypothetical protein [Saprospiraceae bacterium]